MHHRRKDQPSCNGGSQRNQNHCKEDAGVDIISDGEQGKTGFLLYGSQRLAGFEQVELRPGQRSRARRRDQVAFAEFYEEYFKTKGDAGNRCAPDP